MRGGEATHLYNGIRSLVMQHGGLVSGPSRGFVDGLPAYCAGQQPMHMLRVGYKGVAAMAAEGLRCLGIDDPASRTDALCFRYVPAHVGLALAGEPNAVRCRPLPPSPNHVTWWFGLSAFGDKTELYIDEDGNTSLRFRAPWHNSPEKHDLAIRSFDMHHLDTLRLLLGAFHSIQYNYARPGMI
jgi:hypothetical protein